MIPQPQRNIVDLIGETSPYLFENADKIAFKDNPTEFPLHQPFESFERENFSDFIKILTTMGSLNLVKEMKTEEKNYFLAEKLRIRRISHQQPSGLLVAKISPQLENHQKGKSLIEIRDDANTLFQMEVDYYIFNEPSFKKIFEPHYNGETDAAFPSCTLPETSLEYLNENEFNVTVNGFTRDQCKGHFENYQIVPAVYIAKCILKNVFKSAPANTTETAAVEIENVEAFLNKAMPVDTAFKVNVSIFRLQKNLKTYKCTVTDYANEYGHYFITLKNLIN
ncbi:hypothetical protein [Flavobacterium sp. UGB4466]|uniref:hypothetical protein n=1 Tax=Flavobacterium sp. UGB4466 TaxID=2730889 RepID=UPI00192AED86|nr:hypothetical protein [Flavobacterium sp. UGB4466]